MDKTLLDKFDMNNKFYGLLKPNKFHQRDYLIDSILRNLHKILNSRRQALSQNSQRACGSLLLNYGLVDLSQFNPRSNTDRELLTDQIKSSIEAYEPRLANVTVELLDSKNALVMNLHFRIEATAQTNNETILFYFELDPVTNTIISRELQ